MLCLPRYLLACIRLNSKIQAVQNAVWTYTVSSRLWQCVSMPVAESGRSTMCGSLCASRQSQLPHSWRRLQQGMKSTCCKMCRAQCKRGLVPITSAACLPTTHLMVQSLVGDRTSKKCGSSQSKSQPVEMHELAEGLLPELLKVPVLWSMQCSCELTNSSSPQL